jgi:hypothetical protein
MNWIKKYLAGGDLRSVGKVGALIPRIKNQEDFDLLMNELLSEERIVAMRAADAVEKITIHHKEFLQAHKQTLFRLAENAINKELKWHLALLILRLKLNPEEKRKAWKILKQWALDKKESRIVRVNALQGLYELAHDGSPAYNNDLQNIIVKLEAENIPSISARIKKLRKLS